MNAIGSMLTCTSTEDNMVKFTRSVNLYEGPGLHTPRKVENVLGTAFSTLVYKAEMDKVIATMLVDAETSGTYPLLGTKCVPRLMPNLDEHIGEGTVGHVYSQLTSIGPIAVKFQEHSSGSNRSFQPGNSMDVPMNAFEVELAFQLNMSSMGMAPCVYNAWTSAYNTSWGSGMQDVLVMDRLDDTLREKTLREKDYTNEVMELIWKMHETNVFHGDMHSGNIMVDNATDMPFVIDFGKSKAMPDGHAERVWCMVHDYTLLYMTLPRRSALKPMVKSKILQLAPTRTVLGTTFDLSD